MPIGAIVAGVGIAASTAVQLSASSQAADATNHATDVATQNNRDSIAAQEAQQERAIQATREATDRTIATTDAEQTKSLGSITDLEGQNIGSWQQLADMYRPYVENGVKANNALSNPSASFMTSPGYQFRLDQGLNAVGTNKAVNGLLKSGSALKAYNDYAAGSASQEFNNWWTQQKGLSDSGLTAGNVENSATAGIAGARNTIANATQTGATARGNAAAGAATNVSNVAAGAADANSQAIANGTTSTNNAIMNNAATQGNAALSTANGISSGIGSITDLLNKYGVFGNTDSSYKGDGNGEW